MNDAATYSAAVYQNPPVVIGCKLQPFTLGHSLLLHRMASPFLTGDAIPQWGDFLLAVELCRTGPDEAARRLQSWSFPRCLSVLGPVRFVRWQSKLVGEMERFVEYLNEAHTGPEMWNKTDGKKSGIPYLLNIQVAAMHWLGLSEEETLKAPLRSLLWQVYACAEMQGVAETVNESEAKAMETLECRN